MTPEYYAAITAMEAQARAEGVTELRWCTKWSKRSHRYPEHASSVGSGPPRRVAVGVYPECKNCEARWESSRCR